VTREGHFFMEIYIEVTIENVEQEQASLLIAAFTACGFTGFLEEQHGLKAYIPSCNYCEEQVTVICKKENCAFLLKRLRPRIGMKNGSLLSARYKLEILRR